MAHGKERKEKNCLNCGTEVAGRFCQTCGQENIIPTETFWGMVRHFVEDITHFHGKFFPTVAQLFTKPGFLPKQYVDGKRERYLNPIRMYVFTSAMFFLILFAVTPKLEIDKDLTDLKEAIITKTLKDTTLSRPEKLEILTFIRDSMTITSLEALDSLSKSGVSKEFREDYLKDKKEIGDLFVVNTGPGYLKRKINSSISKVNSSNKSEVLGEFTDNFLHRVPIIMFVSLPFFALGLYMLYIRNKKFKFFHHGIFTIYLYIFQFIITLLSVLSYLSAGKTGLGFFNFLLLFFICFGTLYTLFAMKYFYWQSWRKTIVKFFLMTFYNTIVMCILFSIFLVFEFVVLGV